MGTKSSVCYIINLFLVIFRHNSDYYYWYDLLPDDWADELGGMKEMISTYANIPMEDIVGKNFTLLDRLWCGSSK